MGVALVAAKHGLAIARVAGEEDPYASLVRKTIGPPRLLKLVFAPAATRLDEKLQDVVTKALSDAGISCVKHGMYAAREVYEVVRAIEDRISPSPAFQMIEFGSSRMLLIANSGVSIRDLLKTVFLSKRVRAAIDKSIIKSEVQKEIEDLLDRVPGEPL